jgi:nucleotide-binding universal stress UspA family protein
MVPVIGEGPKLNLKAIVCATDFSTHSQNAGLYAALLAEYFSAKLLIAHAFTLSQAAMEAEAERGIVSQQRTDLERLLSQRASALSEEPISAIPVLLDGDPKKTIPELADKNAPSLIVLGTHGGSRIGREIIGSVAEGVLRSTSWPCLTVGPNVQPGSSETVPFRRILYVTDFTPAAAGAAGYAVSFAESFLAEIDVLNVVQSGAIDHPDRLNDLREHFYRALENVVPQHAQQFCHPRTFVEVGNAHHQILQHIQERSVDLLVLGIRKSSHLSIETRTSGAFGLIAQAPCPVLTVVG